MVKEIWYHNNIGLILFYQYKLTDDTLSKYDMCDIYTEMLSWIYYSQNGSMWLQGNFDRNFDIEWKTLCNKTAHMF